MRAFSFVPVLCLAVAAVATAQTAARGPAPNSYSTKSIVFWNVSHESIEFLLRNAPQPDAVRVAQLKQVFIDLQCSGNRLREQQTGDGENLLCTMPASAPLNGAGPGLIAGSIPDSTPGSTPASVTASGTIVVLAHYEHQGSGKSAVCNWSGAVMLPLLYHALAATPRHHNFIFAEVEGEQGAQALFDSFTPAQRHAIQGVVALDALGLGPAQFYMSPNDMPLFYGFGWFWLQHELAQAAVDQRFAAPVAAIPGRWQRVDAAQPFRHHGIPSILIHSVTFGTRGIPGSADDTPEAINREFYFSTLKLLSDYMVELDGPWPAQNPGTASGRSGGRHR
jgi:hypothetical protein